MAVTYKQAAVVEPGKELQLREASLDALLAALPPDGVAVRVSVAGVCHTDVHLWQGYFRLGPDEKDVINFANRYSYPKVPGHEIAGTVYALGKRAKRASGFSLGDRVVVLSLVGCDECPACKVGDVNLCTGKMRDLGFAVDGGYSEFVSLPHYKYTFKTPDALSDELAALLPCSALTAFSAIKNCSPAVERVKRWRVDLLIAVIGMGGLGQWLLKLIHHCISGVHIRIVGVDVSEAKLEHVMKEKLVDDVFLIRKEDTPSQQSKSFLEKFNNCQPHIIFDFVNVTETFDFSFGILHKGGTHSTIGLHGGCGKIPLPIFVLNSHSMVSTMMGSLTDLSELISLVAKESAAISPPTITCYPLEEASKALTDLHTGGVIGRAVLKMSGV